MTDQEQTPRHDEQTDDNWDRDLHPDNSLDRNESAPTAFDVKVAHRHLADLGDDDLKQISIIPDGTRLDQGATYIDLLGSREEFSAIGSMEGGKGHAYVAKADVDYQLWNRLIGVDNPKRLSAEDED